MSNATPIRQEAPEHGSGLWRGSIVQRLRLISGLVLFVFAATHFLTHALGLVSLEAMNAVGAYRVVVTRSLAGSVVLATALIAHVALAAWSLLRRRSWTMPPWQWVQIALGFLIPLQLLPHIVGTGVAARAFGVRTDYSYELARIWTATILPQSLLLLAVWVHGCVGLHFWLRLWAGYTRALPVLFALAVLVPFAALAGVSVQGRAVAAVMADPTGAAALRAATRWPDAAAWEQIDAWDIDARFAYGAGLAALALTVGLLTAAALRRKRIAVRYVDGPRVWSEPGPTLLDISRRNAIPHVAVCGGRGRCSTCRVLVIEGAEHLTPPEADERRTLQAVAAGPHVRLACQACPTGSVTILPMLKAERAREIGRAGPMAGTERDLAVLFVDLRGFTALTERRLPFDVIFILNQFFAAVGEPIHAAGGWIANYAGDGVIALFDDAAGMGGACRAALVAAAGIDEAMIALNERLIAETRLPMRVAMGLHAGPHVMGSVGFGAGHPTAVIGLPMNVASRLEALAKQAGVQLALSRVVADHAGLDTAGLRMEPIEVRGLSRPLDVVFVPSAGALLGRLEANAAQSTTLDRVALP